MTIYYTLEHAQLLSYGTIASGDKYDPIIRNPAD